MSRGLLSSFQKVYSPSPFFLILYVTSRCNARCKMCYNWQNIDNWKNRNELSLEEIERITQSISSLQQLTISGGEPFLREDLADILKLFAKNCNVSWITIPTNGLLPDRIEQTMERACTENPDVHFRIGLSMSETEERMDELYGVKGSFEKNQQSYEVVSRLAQAVSQPQRRRQHRFQQLQPASRQRIHRLRLGTQARMQCAHFRRQGQAP